MPLQAERQQGLLTNIRAGRGEELFSRTLRGAWPCQYLDFRLPDSRLAENIFLLF